MTKIIKCYQITISGDLYGRGLRSSAMYIAFTLHVTGFVQYTHAGNIMMEAEADEEHLAKFFAWLRNFVQSWKVTDITIVETAVKGYSAFDIRIGAGGDDAVAQKSFVSKLLNLFSERIQRMFGYDNCQNTLLK